MDNIIQLYKENTDPMRAPQPFDGFRPGVTFAQDYASYILFVLEDMENGLEPMAIY